MREAKNNDASTAATTMIRIIMLRIMDSFYVALILACPERSRGALVRELTTD